MAVRQGWQIPESVMAALPNAMALLALDPRKQDRTRINAAKVLVQMHGQNEPVAAPTVNVGVAVTVGDHIRALLGEPDYLDFLRQQEGSDSGVICADS